MLPHSPTSPDAPVELDHPCNPTDFLIIHIKLTSTYNYKSRIGQNMAQVTYAHRKSREEM